MTLHFHSPRIRTDQNGASLKRAENIMRHVEMWSPVKQKGNIVSVVKAVHKVDRFSHKIVQVHQQGKTPLTAHNVGIPLGSGRSDQSRLTFSLSGL